MTTYFKKRKDPISNLLKICFIKVHIKYYVPRHFVYVLFSFRLSFIWFRSVFILSLNTKLIRPRITG